MSKPTPTERLLKSIPTPLTVGEYIATPDSELLERLVSREPQVAVMAGRPGMAEGEKGMLVAICGPSDDPASAREATLFAAAPELFDACVAMVDYLNDSHEQEMLEMFPHLWPLRRIFEQAKSAAVKAMVGDFTIEEALAQYRD